LRPSLLRRIGNSWRDRKKKSATIDIVADGFIYTKSRAAMTVRWDDITRIDAGLRDGISFDLLYTVLHTKETQHRIDELDDGFRLFENAVLDRWPALRERWVAMQCGPAHQPRYETLWQRER
jgi:hypothetical protein